MFIHLLGTTSGMTWENGKMIDVPKKVHVRLGTCGFRQLDKRYKKISTIENIAYNMMEKQNNKVGFAIYCGTISNPHLISKFIHCEFRHLETDLENA